MNQLASWMMRLYPTRWRARYGDELNALIEDTGADARIVTDLFRGGMRMQLKTWPFPKLAFALGLLGLLLGAGFARLLPSEYVSKATMQITPATIDDSMIQSPVTNSLNERIQRMETQVLSRNSLVGIVKDPRVELYSPRVNQLGEKPLDDVLEEMKRDINIQFVALPGALGRRASAFDISFRYFDPFKAQQMVRELILAFEAESQKESAASSDGSNKGLLEELDPPNLPAAPFSPSRTTAMWAGFIVGILIASVWRIVQRTGFIVRQFAPVAVAFGIVGLATVIVANSLDLVPYQYRSKATLGLPHGAGADQIPALQAEVFSRTSLASVINSPHLRLYQNELRATPLEGVIQTMKQHLVVNPIYFRDRIFFDVVFDYPDRYKAQEAVSMLASRFFEADQRLFPTGSAASPPAPLVLEILDPASLPIQPTSPKRYMIAWTGCLIGFALAGAIALIRRRWKPEADFPVDALPE